MGVDCFVSKMENCVARRLLSLVSVPFLLAGCAPGSDLSPLPPLSGHEYRLGPGDIVRIITYGEDPLTGEFRVSDQGIDRVAAGRQRRCRRPDAAGVGRGDRRGA